MATQEKRPGGSKGVGSKATGGLNAVRVGNTPAVVVDIDSPGQRHTTGRGQVEFTSENFPVRANAVQTGETFSGDGGQFEFNGTPESGEYIQRSRIPRQQVQDAEVKSLSDKGFQNEKEQRKVSETLKKDVSNPRNQR